MIKSDLKRKTVRGFFWSSIESILSQGQGIIFGIFLARMLSPQEFGLLGMITIFISFAQVFVDSGLSHSLIRKQYCNDEDYSTVFWVNLIIGILCYAIIWISAPEIAKFYGKPELVSLTRIISLSIVIGSVTLIQQTILTKDLDFKTITKSSVTGTFVAGVVSLLLAYYGYGVWSLVWRTIINQFVRSLILWKQKRWSPRLYYNKLVLKSHFGFGSKILLISILAALYKNFYNLIIGKIYSAKVLGYYTNADQYSLMPSSTISSITNKVSYPVLSQLQADNVRLRAGVNKLIPIVMFVSFAVMFGLGAIAKPLFIIVLGKKWLPSVVMFQAFCFAYAITPMQILNQNIMKVKSRSDLFLKTEIIKYIVFIPVLLLGAIYGITVLIAGIVLFYWIGYIISTIYSKRLVGYTMLEQTVDFLPVMAITLIPALITWGLEFFLPASNIVLLALQCIIYPGLVIILAISFKVPAFFEILRILRDKLTVSNFIKTFTVEK